jgi:hypothetical protein
MKEVGIGWHWVLLLSLDDAGESIGIDSSAVLQASSTL